MIVRWIGIALLTAGLATAQPAGRVQGRVTTPAGEPVGKATVRLMYIASPAQAFVEVTSSDGRYSVENLPAGRYALTASKAGFVTMLGGNEFALAAGESKSGVDTRLTPLAVISGNVSDADGDPVQGARIELLRYTFAQGRKVLSPAPGSATTDDRGEFRMLNVSAGRYYVLASAPSLGATARDVVGASAQRVNLPTFYPSSLDERGAAQIDVGSGELSGVRIRLQKGRTYSLQATVTDQSGNAAAGVQATLAGRDGTPARDLRTASVKGGFQLSNLQAGEYTLFVRSNSSVGAPGAATPKPTYARANIRISGDSNLSIQLRPGVEIGGRVSIEGGGSVSSLVATLPAPRPAARAVPAGTVTQPAPAAGSVPPPARRLTVILSASESIGVGRISANVDESGVYKLENVPPGRYFISFNMLPPGIYVKSIRFGGQDLTHAPLDFESGPGGVLDITLSTGGSVTGIARNSEGAVQPGSRTILWPSKRDSGSPSGGVREARADDQGGFQFTGLAPGEYYVAAWEDAQSEYLRIPDFLARFNDTAEKVAVTEGQAASVDAGVIPRAAQEEEWANFP